MYVLYMIYAGILKGIGLIGLLITVMLKHLCFISLFEIDFDLKFYG